jgi:hypothetical protein
MPAQARGVVASVIMSPMRRIGRWMINGLTVLSLVLCMATARMWVRSYSIENLMLEFQNGQCLLIGIDAPPKAVRSARESAVLDYFLFSLRTPAIPLNGVTFGPPQVDRRFGFEWVRGTGQLYPNGDSYTPARFWIVSVPLWFIALAATAGPTWVFCHRRITARRRRLRSPRYTRPLP